METKLIDLEQLKRSPLNARRTSRKDGLAELKASILAHGLMQNLVVTADDGGRYCVIAGGRRLEALNELRAEGKLSACYAVPCQVVADEHAAEMSLAENVVRQAMHPADEFEAFAALVESGHTTDEVAERFGTTTKHVEQRLRLGRVAPELIAEYRAGIIDLECLQAFTVTDDRKKQLSVYNSAQGWQKGNANYVRRCLTESTVESDNKLARFVGFDAYRAEGGTVRTDLFGETSYLEDAELLNRLVSEKLGEAEAKLEHEGWGWVEVAEERDWSFVGKHGRIKATPTEVPAELVAERKRFQAELDAMREAEEPEDGFDEEHGEREEELEEQLQAVEDRVAEFVAFDPKKMKSAGCYVYIDHDGRLVVERGLVRKKDEQKLAKGKKAKAAEAPGVSDALRRDLEAFRLQVAQAAIARCPEIAFDLLVFNLASQTIGFHALSDGPDVRLGLPGSGDEQSTAGKALLSLWDLLPKEWLNPDSEAERFQQFRQLPDAEKRSLLAYCTASALQPRLARTAEDKVTAYDFALAQTSVDVADYWRPTKASYLGRITCEQLLAIGEEMFGPEWAKQRRNDKKAKLAEVLDAAFAKPGAHSTTPEQVEKLKTWLPAGMSFSFAFEPKPEKPAKAKKGKKVA